MTATTAMLIVAPVLATALLLRVPVRDAAVWVRSGASCTPAATRAVPLAHLAGSVRDAQPPAVPRALPDARNPSPSCMPHKVILT